MIRKKKKKIEEDQPVPPPGKTIGETYTPCRVLVDERWHTGLLRPDYRIPCGKHAAKRLSTQFGVARKPGWYVEVYSQSGGGHRVVHADAVTVGGVSVTQMIDADVPDDTPVEDNTPLYKVKAPPPPPPKPRPPAPPQLAKRRTGIAPPPPPPRK